MTNTTEVACKEGWIAPEIKTLDVAKTENLPGRGSDGGAPVDCTRS